jgi:hypothetical protein
MARLRVTPGASVGERRRLRRCSFVYLAGCLLSASEPPLAPDACAAVRDALAQLADDRVPNVRLAVARLLVRLHREGRADAAGANALARLATDADSDVRWHAVERDAPAPACQAAPVSEDDVIDGLSGLRVDEATF